MDKDTKSREEVDFHYLGLDFLSRNPGPKTLILVGMLLAFFLGMSLLWRPFGLGIFLIPYGRCIQEGVKSITSRFTARKKNNAP